ATSVPTSTETEKLETWIRKALELLSSSSRAYAVCELRRYGGGVPSSRFLSLPSGIARRA
ncbi:MAG: hypothetical protein KDC14_08505, partial [Planctomycetes bacterium]|nr:hypothetical protein [Planctomycetota bacterium]